jgi:hypothetical protein
MAKQFIDADITTEMDNMAISSGAALTLTNDVRILYDDALDTSVLYATITRIRDKILENEQ